MGLLRNAGANVETNAGLPLGSRGGTCELRFARGWPRRDGAAAAVESAVVAVGGSGDCVFACATRCVAVRAPSCAGACAAARCGEKARLEELAIAGGADGREPAEEGGDELVGAGGGDLGAAGAGGFRRGSSMMVR